MKSAIAALLLVACVDQVVPVGDTSLCERYAKKFGTTECGVVYEFPIPAQTPSGFIEWCIPERYAKTMPEVYLLDLAESKYGPSKPSPRFPIPDPLGINVVDPPCAFQCPSHEGCNAYVDTSRTPYLGGCYCPFGPDT